MEQSRLMSLCETVVGTAVGFVVSSLAWRFVVVPVWHMPADNATNMSITGFFTVLSLVRGYAIRRFFARGMRGAAAWLASVVQAALTFVNPERATKPNSTMVFGVVERQSAGDDDLARTAALLRRR